MKSMIFITILICGFSFATFAQSEVSPPPIVDPDVFYKMSWKDEKLRLKNFAQSLNSERDKVGFITLKLDKKTTKNQAKIRLNRITYYLVKTEKIEKSRFKLIVSDNNEIEETVYWIVDRTQIPKR